MKIRHAGRLAGVERTLIRQIFDRAPADAINLGLGQPDLPTPPLTALAGIAGIAAGRTGYTSTAGDPGLRQAIAEHYAGFADGPENVVVTIGSQEAMFVTCMALADAGDEILVPDPGYPAYPVVARLLGAQPVSYPLRAEKGFRLQARDVAERLSDRTRAVILCAPSNPTGAGIEPEQLESLTRLLEQRQVPWVSDEIYAGFYYAGTFLSPARIAPHGGIVISSLSKDLSMTGWRVGWAVGPEEILSRIIAAHQYVVTCAPSVSQCAARAAFGPAGRRERERHLEIFRRRREVMAQELSQLPGIRFQPPDGAFYFFVDVSRHGSSLELAQRILERQRVVTIPGEAFGPAGAGFLRLSFAAPEDQLREGVRRIGLEIAAGAP